MKKLLFVLLILVAGDAFAQAASKERLMGLGVPPSQASELVKLGTIKSMTVTDNDAQDNTLTIAEIVGGITVHTSVTAGGTVTTDSAANIIAGASGVSLGANNDCISHIYVNDGSQTLTFAAGSNVTISDTGNTILTNESALLIFCRTSSTAVTMHIVQ